jgi:hypothetical protein
MVATKPRIMLVLAGISLVLTASTQAAWAQSFDATGNMATGRIGHTARLLNGGKVLVTGGIGYRGYSASAELYVWLVPKTCTTSTFRHTTRMVPSQDSIHAKSNVLSRARSRPW